MRFKHHDVAVCAELRAQFEALGTDPAHEPARAALDTALARALTSLSPAASEEWRDFCVATRDRPEKLNPRAARERWHPPCSGFGCPACEHTGIIEPWRSRYLEACAGLEGEDDEG